MTDLRDLLESPGQDKRRRPWWPWVLLLGAIVSGGTLLRLATDDSAPEQPAVTTGPETPATTVPSPLADPPSEVVAPPSRSYMTLTPLPGSNLLLLVGGTTGHSATGSPVERPWVFALDSETWAEMEGLPVPEGRIGHAAAHVASLDAVLVVGGGGRSQTLGCLRSCPPGFHDDLWLYSESGWDPMAASGPGPRSGHAVAYDPGADRVVLFGGMLAPSGAARDADLGGDTWLFDPATSSWEEVEAAGPAPRAFHAMTYDPVTGTVLMWGGFTEDGRSDPAVWSFDAADLQWREMPAPSGDAPVPRWHHVWVAEPESGLVVMIGGNWRSEGRERYGSDVWLYDPATAAWERTDDLGGPVLWTEAAPGIDGEVVLFSAGSTGFFDTVDRTWRWLSEE